MRVSAPLFLTAALLLGAARPAAAQMAPPSSVTVPVAAASGVHVGADTTAGARPDATAEPFADETTRPDSVRLAYQTTVRVPDARWLRLRFADARLGAGSFLRITSLEDRAVQRLDARGLASSRLHSAFFNGDAVTVELFVAPGDPGALVDVAEAVAGTPPPAGFTICDSGDERAASSDAAVGRLLTPGGGVCTGWLGSSGAFFAAGHCTATTVLEFNVPASDADGSINHPDPEDQYDLGAFVFEAVPDPNDPDDTIRGQDWMVFAVDRNTTSGLTVAQAQAAFYRVTQDSNPGSFRITGHGVDDGAANATQQTDTGTNEGETFNDANWVLWEHRVDTRGGNSGSPISLTNQALSVGIHTHGGCTSTGGANAGVSFESDDLAAALDDFFGTNVVHLDNGHPFASGSGTPLRPYATLPAAVTAVPSGGSVRAVAGTYAVGPSVYTKAMVWAAPVGAVVVQ